MILVVSLYRGGNKKGGGGAREGDKEGGGERERGERGSECRTVKVSYKEC